ncbi:hypothetical protein [Singulisphaera sp. PoT]
MFFQQFITSLLSGGDLITQFNTAVTSPDAEPDAWSCDVEEL